MKRPRIRGIEPSEGIVAQALRSPGPGEEYPGGSARNLWTRCAHAANAAPPVGFEACRSFPGSEYVADAAETRAANARFGGGFKRFTRRMIGRLPAISSSRRRPEVPREGGLFIPAVAWSRAPQHPVRGNPRALENGGGLES